MIKTGTKEDYQERIERTIEVIRRLENIYPGYETLPIEWSLRHSREEINRRKEELAKSIDPPPQSWLWLSQFLEDPDEDND